MNVLRPLGDRLVVKVQVTKHTESGIYTGCLQDDGFVKELVNGTILAVGPGMLLSTGRRESMWDLKPGDTVSFSPVCAYVSTEDPDLWVIRRDAIAGKRTNEVNHDSA